MDIQAQCGDEIALSIMAEIVQRRRNAEMLNLALFSQKADSIPLTIQPEQPRQMAIDPIWQMEVEIATAKYTYEYKGQLYYFCGAGCRATFAKTPEAYLQIN